MKALLCLVGLAAIPMTAAHALHYPGHFEGSTPRQADHSGICENYEKITRTRKLSKAERKKLDRQYKKNCRSQSGSSPPSPVQAPDNSSNSDSQNPSIAAFTMPRCLKNDTPVEVSGQSLKSGGLNCSVGSRTLKPKSSSQNRFIYTLGPAISELPAYLQCEVPGDKKRQRITACEKEAGIESQVPTGISEPAQAKDGNAPPDLVAEITPQGVNRGEMNRIRFSVRNNGGPAKRKRYWVKVYLSESNTQTMGASAIQADREQRMRRVPVRGLSERASVGIKVPAEAANARYWCVEVDHRNDLKESNETNNLTCAAVPGGGEKNLAGVFGKKLRMNANPVLPAGLPAPVTLDPALIRSPGCPDPAVERLSVQLVYENGLVRPYVSIEDNIRNQGSRNFVSSSGQQVVHPIFVSQGGVPEQSAANAGFTRIEAGQWMGTAGGWYGSSRAAFNPDEDIIPQGLGLRIVYGPDIFIDGNPLNDDCDLGNNELFVSGQQLLAWAREGRTLIEYNGGSEPMFTAVSTLQSSPDLKARYNTLDRRLDLGKGILPLNILPEDSDRIPAMLPMTLRANGEPGLFPVSVEADGSLEISWLDLPEQIDGDRVSSLYLRASSSPFEANDCVTSAGGWSGDLGLTEQQNYSSVPSGSVSINMSQRGIFPGARLYFKGCVGVERGGLTYVEETNTAQVEIAGGLVAVTEAAETIEIPEHGWPEWADGFGWAELGIVDMIQIRTGPNRGKIAVLVSAQRTHPELPEPRQAPFVVQLKLPVRGIVWEGVGRVKNLLFGMGDYVVTDFIPDEPMMLEAIINPPGADPLYEDHSGHDNRLKKPFNWREPAREPGTAIAITELDEVIDDPEPLNVVGEVTAVERLRATPQWSLLRAHYRLSPFWSDSRGVRCELRAYARVQGSEAEPGHRDPVMCGQSLFSYGYLSSDLPPSEGRYIEFFCFGNPYINSGETVIARETVKMECGDAYTHGFNVTESAINAIPFTLGATPSESVNIDAFERRDFFISDARVVYRDGAPRGLRINISNVVYAGATSIPVQIQLVKAGRVVRTMRYASPTVSNPANPTAGIGLISLAADGLRWREVDDGRLENSWINIRIDPDRQLAESDRGNNQQTVPVHGYYPD